MRDIIEKFIIRLANMLIKCKKCGLLNVMHKMSCKKI